MKEGDELVLAGAWDEAVYKYGEAVRLDPENINYRLKYRKARTEAALQHYKRGDERLEDDNLEAALYEYQTALLLDPTIKKADEAARTTQRAIDSEAMYEKGVDALKSGRRADAEAFLKKAVSLNSNNEKASAELDKIKKEKGVVIDGFELDVKSQKPITLEFKDASVKNVFNVLAKLSGMNFIFDADMKDTRTSIFLRNASFKEALDFLLATNNLEKKVLSEDTIIVYSSTPQKLKQYRDMLLKVFYLKNIDAKKAVNLLRTMVKAKDIYVHEELNAIVLRADPSAVALAEKILAATDLADSEVVLTVEILEVSKNKNLDIGVKAPQSVSINVPQVIPEEGKNLGGLNLGGKGDLVLSNLSTADLLAVFPIPTGTINLKSDDLNVETLANPRIRVRNNGKAKIHIGDRIPIITSIVASTGVSTENVQYQDVGVKFNVEPTIRPGDEIDIKLSLEISSLGAAAESAAGNTYYQIGTRNAETVLRLYDGETQLIGGLLSDEERNTVVKIPGLGDIPIIGRIFSNTTKSKVKSEILLSITPHIVRRLEVPDEDTARIWSGKEDNPSAASPLEFTGVAAAPSSGGSYMETIVEPPPPPDFTNMPENAPEEDVPQPQPQIQEQSPDFPPPPPMPPSMGNGPQPGFTPIMPARPAK